MSTYKKYLSLIIATVLFTGIIGCGDNKTMEKHIETSVITSSTATGGDPNATSIKFTTGDGIVISGVYMPASQKQNYTFILLHGLGSTKEEWQSFEKILSDEGYGYFAYDARGHGESIHTSSGETIQYESFGPPESGYQWSLMPDDLGETVKLLSREFGIRRENIVLTGSSLGSIVCLIYAASDREIPVIIALSPGMEYTGFISSLTDRRVLFAASLDDQYAYDTCQTFYDMLRLYGHAAFFQSESGHGVQMFDGKFEQDVLRWIKNDQRG